MKAASNAGIIIAAALLAWSGGIRANCGVHYNPGE